VAGDIVRSAYQRHAEDDDFGQPGTLYREVLGPADREHLANNIIGHATSENPAEGEVRKRVVEYWTNVDPELGAQVSKGLNGG
jgi:catalase